MSNAIEAAFLQRQQDRWDGLKVKRERQAISNAAVTANHDTTTTTAATIAADLEWFHEQLRLWKGRVEALTTTTTKTQSTVVTNESRGQMRWKVCQYQEELHDLRRQCLCTLAAATTTGESMSQWHEEFVSCQSLLDTTKASVLPKTEGKFVFRRYREAVIQRNLQKERQLRRNNQQPKEEPPPLLSTTTTTQEESLGHDERSTQQVPKSSNNNNGRLENYQNVTLKIYKDSFQVLPRNGNDDGDDNVVVVGGTKEPHHQQQQQQPGLLFHLSHCRVEYHLESTEFPSIHLVNCSHVDLCCVVVAVETTTNPKIQSVHVTDCTHCTLFGEDHHVTEKTTTTTIVQQLRLHESSHLACHCYVTGGAILEACHDITFYNLELSQIKDFHWLKPRIPSPNFTIIQKKKKEEEPLVLLEHKAQFTAAASITPPPQASITSATAPPGETQQQSTNAQEIDSDEEI